MSVHGVYFHAWHFLYSQVQLTVWFGNVVAGVVVFVVMDILWRWFGRRLFHAMMKRIHADSLEEIHAKLDHVILHHPDIPPLKGKK